MKISANVRRQVLSLAIPASLESVLQMSFGFFDQVIIARLGEAPLAAVGITNQLVFLITLVLGAIAATTAILVAQHHGRADPEGVSQAAGASFIIGGLVSLPLALLMFLAPASILSQLGAEADVVEIGAPFIRLISLTVPMALLGTIAVAVLRSLDDAKTPMLITLAAVALNTGLNVILVFGFGPIPALGVVGAAIATVGTQFLRLVLLFYCMWARQRKVRFDRTHFLAWPTHLILKIVRLSAPIALTEVFWALGAFLYTLMCIKLGTTVMAANQVIIATESVFIMCSSGLAVAALTLVGQAIGAGELGEVSARARYIIRVSLVSSLVFGGLLLFTGFGIELFYPELAAEVIHLATIGLLVMALFQPAKVLNMVMGNGVLRAGADNRYVLMADLVSIYGFGLPTALALGFFADLGIIGIFAGRVVEEVSRVLIFIVRYRSQRWHHTVVRSADQTEELRA